MNKLRTDDPEKRVLNLGVSTDSPESLARSMLEACARWRAELIGISMRGVAGGPDWRAYETRIWELGEALRLFLKPKKALRTQAVTDALSKVVVEKEFGKGRQTFALLLGEFGDESHREVLGWALKDDEIAGHALKSVQKLRLDGFGAEVRQLLDRSRLGWIRSAAKKYLETRL